jgi:hypothetical protein
MYVCSLTTACTSTAVATNCATAAARALAFSGAAVPYCLRVARQVGVLDISVVSLASL